MVLAATAVAASYVQAWPCLSQGTWVWDPSHRPKYTSNSCPYIRSLNNCLRNGRRDGAYQHWAWRTPARCPVDQFTAATFLHLLSGLTVMFIGDSVMSNFFEALMCLIHADSRVRINPYKRKVGRMFLTTGYKIVSPYGRPVTVHRVGSLFLVKSQRLRAPNWPGGQKRRGGAYGMIVDLDAADPVWAEVVGIAHVAVFHSGHWFSSRPPNRRVGNVYRVGGRVRTMQNRIAHGRSLETVARALQRRRYSGVPMFLSYPVMHDLRPLLPGRGKCNIRRPLNATTMRRLVRSRDGAGALAMFGTQRNSFSAVAAQSALAAGRSGGGGGTRMTLVDITRLTLGRPDGHLQRYWKDEKKPWVKVSEDCLHWCLPGVPDAWADVLLANMVREPRLASRVRR